jgi:methylmalonyl-CoA mutase, N-terminal domain
MSPEDQDTAAEFHRWLGEVYEPACAKSPERAIPPSTSGFEIGPLGAPVSPSAWRQATVPSDSDALAGAPAPRRGNLDAGTVAHATEDKIGFPGEYPYTRGIQPTMYRGRLWTMRQYSGFSTAEAANERYRYLLAQGQTGLSVAFDLPTQMGYDSSHPLAEGEVGKTGVAIDTVEDMRALFKDIPLDKVTTSMTINAPAAILLLMYQIVAEDNGVDPAKLGGTIQNDILKEYMARGTYIFPPEPSMLLTVDTFRYCTERLPQWNMISVSGYHIREAGCSAVQEVAFTLGDGIEYVRRAVEAGLDVDAFAGRLSFFFNAHNNLLEEVAKFRAARRLWARIMRERFGAKDPRSWMLRFHTQTAGSMLTAQQPYNNVVRTTLQALAAVLGGTQSLHTNSFDEALALPTEFSSLLALRTQQVIAHESGVADTVDPLGGSWFIEELTDRIEAGAEDYIARVDAMGGMAAAIARGYPQADIQQQAYEWQKSIERGERLIVGVNEFRQNDERIPPVERDVAAEDRQKTKLAAYIGGRAGGSTRQSPSRAGLRARHHEDAGRDARATVVVDDSPFRSALAALTQLARDGATGGYCEAIYSSLRAGATLGETVAALEHVWGRYRPGI